MPNAQTKHDAFLWYNVGEWSRFGLAVPNWSDDHSSQNSTIVYFCHVIGNNLQALMFHPDANLSVPPSINTLRRIHMLCVRARKVLAGRAVPPAQANLEPSHAVPAPEMFRVFPTPYFNVRNQWLREWAGLSMLAITEAMQHTENHRPIEISEQFAGTIGQYFHRIYQLMNSELFQIPREEAADPQFTLSEEQLATYRPANWFTSLEMTDTVPALEQQPTEDTLETLSSGIPISQLPALPRWPGMLPAEGPEARPVKPARADAFMAPPGA